jgi:hypothetical protein
VSNLELAERCIALLGSASEIRFQGDDPEEGLAWEVSIDAAREGLGWSPTIPLDSSLAAIAQADSNIDGVEYLERDTSVAAIRFSIEVRNRTHLAHVIRRIRRLGVVHGVQRI